MIGAFIIPTGIGCRIGGHNGDATTAVNLIASVCDELIIHPNCVNASDINEMSKNCLYVEGSMLDRFLAGEIGLKRRKNNKICVALNKPKSVDVINSIRATRYTLGTDIFYVELENELILEAGFNPNGTAGGSIKGYRSFIKQMQAVDCDVIAVATIINIEPKVAINYFQHGGVNPWGGIEADFSQQASIDLGKPVAHSPLDEHDVIKYYKKIVEDRLAPEMVSCSFIHCVLKGLQRAPLAGNEITNNMVDFLVSPYPCFGPPHKACIKNKIPIIYVRENQTILSVLVSYPKIIVNNYWEAAGYIKCLDIGINPDSTRYYDP